MVSDPYLRKISGIAGAALAAVCAILSFEFGWQIHPVVACGLVMITFLAAYTPAIAYDIWTNHGPKAGAVASIMAAAVLGLDITTASSTLTVHRASDQTSAVVHNTTYEDGRANIANLEDRKRMFEARLSQLAGTAGWSATKPSKAYAGEIAAMELAIEQETARGGCKAKCLQLTQRKAEIEANKATAEAHEKDASMLAATVAALEKARADVKNEKVQVSASQTQNVKLASIVTFQRKPGDDALYWTDTWLGVAIGTVLTLAAAFFCWIAHSGRQISSIIANKPAAREIPRSEPVREAPLAPVMDSYEDRLRDAMARLQLSGGAGVTGPARLPNVA
jgi:hypothetical protein